MREKPKRQIYKRRLGKIQKRILLLLAGGLSLGTARSPLSQLKILDLLGKEWKNVKNQTLNESLASLYEARFVQKVRRGDGSVEIVISNQGMKRALVERLDKIAIKKPKKWNGYFWIVLFDIPEDRKRVREAIRGHLKRLGFKYLQKSVFVYPYDCVKEIKFIAEYYNILKNIRIIEARSIDHEKEILDYFKL